MITSSTSPDILGQLYLPYINDATNLAECFLHECMHQYLYRIDSIDSIFKNDGSFISGPAAGQDLKSLTAKVEDNILTVTED